MDFAAYEKEYCKLLDPAEPLDSRTRELYRLKNSILKTSAGVHILSKAIDTTDSVLLQHELVYNLGQTAMDEACPELERIIRNSHTYDAVTRHEAIESLGAIASESSVPILEFYMNEANEPHAAIRESCELALQRIYVRRCGGDAAVQSPANCPFVSIDPAPAFSAENINVKAMRHTHNNNNHHHNHKDNNDDNENGEKGVPSTVEELSRILCDDSGATSLFHRYQAMFSLRNDGSTAAVHALTRALREDTASALFRHEVAFVLGQLEHPQSQSALMESLRDENEAPMVRHEAAEALGAIADPNALQTLKEFATHKEPIVRDSCIVALEMHKYWSKFNKSVLEKRIEEESQAEAAAAAEAAAV